MLERCRVALLWLALLLLEKVSALPPTNINTVNLLLPSPGDGSLNNFIGHTLEAYNGCFEWRSSHPEILTVEPIADSGNARCASKAFVMVAAPHEYSNTVWITARDKDTGSEVKVESRVADLKRIEILTKIRNVHIENFEILELIGYDAVGNAFTTLEGMKFEWALEQTSSIASYVSFKDAAMKTTDPRMKLESRGFQTDMSVLIGHLPGHVVVSATFNGKKETKTSVKINIIEPFIAYPDYDFYLLPRTSLKMELFAILNKNHNETFKRISLPNKNYVWEISDSSIGSIESNGELRVFDKLGSATIKIFDARAPENKIETRVHVVEPWSVRLLVEEEEKPDRFWEEFLPFLFKKKKEHHFDNNWNFVLDRRYYIKAEVVDRQNNKVLLPESAKIKWLLPDSVRLIKDRNHEITVQAISIDKVGSGILASLEGVNYKGGVYRPTNSIQLEKRVNVYSPVVSFLSGHDVLLPFRRGKGSSITLGGIGGSGTYDWRSSNPAVVTVDSKGVATSSGLGKGEIYLSDKSNPKNKAKLVFRVEEPTSMNFIERAKEIEIGKVAHTYLYLLNAKGERFTSCLNAEFIPDNIEVHMLKVNWAKINSLEAMVDELYLFSNQSSQFSKLFKQGKEFLELEKGWKNMSAYERLGEITKADYRRLVKKYLTFGICGGLELTGLKEGEVRYAVSSPFSPQSAYQTVKILTPLKILEPANSDIFAPNGVYLVAYGSDFDWRVQGGVQPWKGTSVLETHIDKVRTDGDRALAIKATKKDFGALVHCDNNELYHKGDYVLTLHRHNNPTEELPLPLKSTANLKITCALPDKIELFEIGGSEVKKPFSISNPRSDYFIPQTLRANHEYNLQAWLFDSVHRPFYSFNGLWIEWGSSNPQVADFSIDHKDSSHSSLNVRNSGGATTLKVFTNSFRENHRQEAFKPIKLELSVNSLDAVYFDPAEKTILLTKDSATTVNILRGSGRFFVTANDSRIVEWRIGTDGRTLTIIPRQIGDVLLTVEDSSLSTPTKSTLLIRVRTPARISLRLSEEAIPKGSQTVLKVRLVDNQGKEFSADQMASAKIQLESIPSNVVKLEDIGHSEYRVIGANIGEVSLRVHSANFPSVNSESVILEVFAPLRIIPGEILNGPECLTSVQLTGGPSAHVSRLLNLSIEFQIEDDSICEFVLPENRVKQELSAKGPFEIRSLRKGNTLVDFKLVDGNGKVLTSAPLKVSIGTMSELKILNMAGRRVHIDAPVRLIAQGWIGSLPMTPSLCPYTYNWRVTNPDVLSLGSEESNLYSVPAVNATGLKEGQADIELKVDLHDGTFKSTTLRASTSVFVIKQLAVFSPTYVYHEFEKNNHVILPPGSSYKVNTNIPSHSMDFKIIHSSPSSNVQVSPRGEISIGSHKGDGVLVITDRSQPDQLSYVNIRVIDVYSILVENSHKAELLPVGGEVTLKVYLQNENGFLFPQPLEGVTLVALPTSLGVVSAKFDQQQSRLTVTANSMGSTYVVVYLDSNPAVYDIFRVEVGSLIMPSGPLVMHVGGQTTFKIGNSRGTVDRVKWESEDNAVLKVTSATGEARALFPGKTNVILKDGQARSQVTVVEIDRLALSPQSTSKIRTISGEKQEIVFDAYAGPYRMVTFDSSKDGVNNHLRFSCSTNQDGIFQSEGKILTNPDGTQKLVCEVSLLEPQSPPRDLPDQVEITAVLTSDTNRGFDFRHTETVPVEWGFYSDTTDRVSFV